MADNKEFKPDNINYVICRYCKNERHILIYSPDDYLYACSKNKTKDGKLRSVNTGQEPIDGFIGCEKFETSGLPAHPQILEELIQINSKCKSIPVDITATETFFEFSHKAEHFLSESNKNSGGHYVSKENVQL